MESTAPFELSRLQRDWIESDSGGSFDALLCQAWQRIRAAQAGAATAQGDATTAQGDAATARCVLIVEADPLACAAAFFAAVYLGVPVALANPNWREGEWAQVASLLPPALIFGAAPLAAGAREWVGAAPQAGHILIPTGGSSGGVKFAVHCWASLRAACEGFERFMGAGAVDTFCVLPLYHVSGLMQLLRSFCSGGRITFGALSAWPAAANRLCLSLVPTQLQRLLEDARTLPALRAARAIFVGGAPMPSALCERARELRLPLVLSYGMTESAAMVAAISAAEFIAESRLPAAPCLPHVKIQILDAVGQLCQPGAVGRIRIQSPSLFQGYHGQPPLDLAQGYLTDDLGRMDAAGRLTVIGRCDALILSGGEKIDPREVERAVLATGLAREVLAVGPADADWGQRLVALYVPSHGPVEPAEWARRLRSQLANYKIPKQWIPLAVLPLDEKGKVQQQELAQIIATHFSIK
jgi:O-succinylbenzoic acid--CoA ligase